MRMARDQVTPADISSGVKAVALIERMFDETKRQSGSDRGDRSRHNIAAMRAAHIVLRLLAGASISEIQVRQCLTYSNLRVNAGKTVLLTRAEFSGAENLTRVVYFLL